MAGKKIFLCSLLKNKAIEIIKENTIAIEPKAGVPAFFACSPNSGFIGDVNLFDALITKGIEMKQSRNEISSDNLTYLPKCRI